MPNQLPRALPSDVEKRPVVIGSDGTRMAGDLYLPKELNGRRLTAVVFCNGSKLMLVGAMPKPDENGEVTVRAKPIRWQLDFADQTYDIRSAISFLCGEKNVDPDRIGIMGSSYGGGLVTWVAGNDDRVKCLVAQVPGMGNGNHPKSFEAQVRACHQTSSW